MSIVSKETIARTLNDHVRPLDGQNKIEGNQNRSIIQRQKEMIKKQLKLVRNKQVRAVPGGYYTGLINDMHKDYQNFQEKRTFLQMEYLNPLTQEIKQTSSSLDRFNDDRKLVKSQAPLTLNSLSIQCTLPSDYTQLENLSPLSYLLNYTKPSLHRQQTILKLIRRIQRDTIMDIIEAKEIVFEYFNRSKTLNDIDQLFRFLDLQSTETVQSNELVLICCYAERYFLDQNRSLTFPRPLQEIIDLEFWKRKSDGLKLTEGLQRMMKTLYGGDVL